MSNTSNNIPFPLTPRLLRQLSSIDSFSEAHPEVVTSRYSTDGVTIP